MKVVLIDDELDICVIVKFMLERAGHEVTSFTSPEVAKDYLSQSNFDVVISDFQMTPLNGLSLFRWLKDVNPHYKPFILLTGEPLMDPEELKKEGIHQVLFKPHGLDDIAEVLKQLN